MLGLVLLLFVLVDSLLVVIVNLLFCNLLLITRYHWNPLLYPLLLESIVVMLLFPTRCCLLFPTCCLLFPTRCLLFPPCAVCCSQPAVCCSQAVVCWSKTRCCLLFPTRCVCCSKPAVVVANPLCLLFQTRCCLLLQTRCCLLLQTRYCLLLQTRSWLQTYSLICADLGAHYYMLPKYSPELNPAEKVFSFLKRMLQSYDIHYDLQMAINECLAKITLYHMIGWYKHSGWLV